MTGSRVLLIEDGRTYAELATYVLEALGWTVIHADTAEEGLRLAQEQPPDLVLMDTNLPGMDGFAAVRALRADPRTKSIPVVGLTAADIAGEEERKHARDAGFDAYVTKPNDKASFSAVVSRFGGLAEVAPRRDPGKP